ncbi:hypothetical protein DBR40_13130 [Pedobacter sp. KBW01]|nr:hypothetical protein DBR40_13130 [Pedobacter sp. KBW01]
MFNMQLFFFRFTGITLYAFSAVCADHRRKTKQSLCALVCFICRKNLTHFPADCRDFHGNSIAARFKYNFNNNFLIFAGK